ncbi:putative polysaccharide biosynthesis protein [Gracilibacillus kekensis]|uniref:Polysaccharide transporter, PST family n=1 Tax=Gracilibacillus kekensis TaxID=1027249 RepID=A0A1M7QZD3_9BACI|nr:polysaccharide biosynthesis protein [Gracilibacillus kekensis]SHN37479.1 polysaccharide transporter, PST family [Gracilibacillus kekensis]
MKETKYVYKGAFALLLAGIFSKVISAFYRIPLQNLTGDVGFYIYQQVYPILGIAFMLALYGFPAAISKYLAEHNRHRQQKGIYLQLFTTLMSVSILIFLAIFLLSPVIAEWMGDNNLRDPIRHTAWVFLFVPFVALLRGGFQSLQWMQPTAYSQMIEQIVRASIIIITAIFIYQGKISVYQIADGAVIASILALSMSFAFLYLYSKKHLNLSAVSQVPEISLRNLFRSIVLAGIIISLNHMLLLLMQLADAFTVVPGLLSYGNSLAEATSWKGIFDRGQPLLQLVTIVGSSFAMAFVPQVTKMNWQMNRQETLENIRLTTKICLLISVGATVGLIALMPEINQLFFKNEMGTFSLRILTISLLFTSLSVTLASTLQGFGYMKWTAFVLFSGLWIKTGLNQWLVPWLGISGGAIATVITVAFIFVSNYFLLRHVIKNARIFVIPWLKVVIASFLMVISVIGLKQAGNYLLQVDNRIALFFVVIASVIAGFIVYAIAIIYGRVLSSKELATLPLPSKWKKG